MKKIYVILGASIIPYLVTAQGYDKSSYMDTDGDGIIDYCESDMDGDRTYDYLDVTSNGVDYDLYTIGRSDLDAFGLGFIARGIETDYDGIQPDIDIESYNRGSPGSIYYHTYDYTLPPTSTSGLLYSSCGIITPLNLDGIQLSAHNTLNNVHLKWETV